MIAGSDTGNGRASSLTDTLPRSPSCASRARRVGSARAAKVRSSSASGYLTIGLSIRPMTALCQFGKSQDLESGAEIYAISGRASIV